MSDRFGCFDRQRTEDVANKIIVSPTLKFCQGYCGLFTCLSNIFEIQTELVKSSKLDLDLGSNLKKSNKTREDFRNREIRMFPNSPAYDNPESGQN